MPWGQLCQYFSSSIKVQINSLIRWLMPCFILFQNNLLSVVGKTIAAVMGRGRRAGESCEQALWVGRCCDFPLSAALCWAIYFVQTHSLGKQTVLFDLCFQQTSGIQHWKGERYILWEWEPAPRNARPRENHKGALLCTDEIWLGDKTPLTIDEWGG